MSVLSSVIQYIKVYGCGAHTRNRNLPHYIMLALSGVVRPSHVELRYLTPIARNPSLPTQPTAIGNPQTHPSLTVMGHTHIQYETDTAMGTQPLILNCPTLRKSRSYLLWTSS